MASAQTGKSSTELAALGYFAHLDPCPILVVLPTIEMSEDWSKERLQPDFERTKPLQNLLKNRSNTLTNKALPGGFIALVGANSPVGLSSRPCRIVIGDEIDRWPASAGEEGDPMDLAAKRTTTFWNSLKVWVSTPTIKGESRIEKAYLESDQRKFYIPCPHCNEYQTLEWRNVKWSEVGLQPSEAVYQCPHCQGFIHSHQKKALLKRGEWRAQAPHNGIAGFHISELYSPWRTFGETAEEFLKVKNDKERLKVWVNTSLGETFEDQNREEIAPESLAAKAEAYQPLTVPAKASILTAGIDVQKDRLVIAVRAWGRNEESWLVWYQQIFGDIATPEPWEQLEAVLSSKFTHASGQELGIWRANIDSGNWSNTVYQYVRAKQTTLVNHRGQAILFATKGLSTPDKPIVNTSTPQEVNYQGQTIKEGIRLWPVGTDTAKATIYARLQLQEPGPGYMHTYQGIDSRYYEEVVGEHIITKWNNGIPKRVWAKIPGRRNEALDCEVLALHAAHALGIDKPTWNWDLEEAKLQPKSESTPTPQPQQQRRSTPSYRPRSNWAIAGTSW